MSLWNWFIFITFFHHLFWGDKNGPINLDWPGNKIISHYFWQLKFGLFFVEVGGFGALLGWKSSNPIWQHCGVCVCVLQYAENFSHSARLFTQQSRAFICSPRAFVQSLYRVLTREIERGMHALAVMLDGNYMEMWPCQNKGAFLYSRHRYLRVASMHRIVIHCINISMNRYTPSNYLIIISWHVQRSRFANGHRHKQKYTFDILTSFVNISL